MGNWRWNRLKTFYMCLAAAAIVTVGLSTNKMKQLEKEWEVETQTDSTAQKDAPLAEVAGQTPDYTFEETVEGETADKETEIETEALTEEVNVSDAVMANFQASDNLIWPVAGNVILDYSMNGTVYFETLNQYKYNPAMIIGAQTGSPVLAAADGIVTDISVEDETGTTVKMDLGNGYELIYGQLKEVPCSVGDSIEAGEAIGYVSEPTKYYCKEGSNLFFQMKKDGITEDPLLYLE